MKINLEYPFSKDFKSGYLNINKEPRRLVLLVDFDNNKTSLSYARYLMSVKEKRYLEKYEHIDHIDNNKLNDDINNLQILSQKENNIKKNEYLGIKSIPLELICPVCNNKFYRKPHRVNYKLKNGKIPTCSRKCGGIYSHKS